MKKKVFWEYLLLIGLLFLAFSVRLYRIDAPLADWHSWRQADTSAVSRNFLKHGYDLLLPRYDDLSDVTTGRENLFGLRFVEFPIYNFFQALTAQVFSGQSLEWWGRMISIVCSLGSILILYFLIKKYLSRRVAFLSSFFFALLPFSIYYSRVILPEPMMVFSSLAMIFFFSLWLEENKLSILYYLLFLLFMAVSLLLKPFTVFLFPVLFYLAWQKWGYSLFKKRALYLAIIAVVPFLLWRWWMSLHPEGVPGSSWLFNAQGIRFKGAFFWWIFGERMGRLILGFWGLPLFVLGIISRIKKKEGWLFHWWLVGILAYFSVIAGGNVRHDYYQVLAIPIVCIFLAKGADYLISLPKEFYHRLVSYLVLFTCIFFMFAFSWHEVRNFYNINHPEIVMAGEKADQILPSGAKVIAPYGGDTAFLYQINRQGWPRITKTVDFHISLGATHYVSVNFDEVTRQLMKDYRVLEETGDYVIIDLTQKQ